LRNVYIYPKVTLAKRKILDYKKGGEVEEEIKENNCFNYFMFWIFL